MSIRLSLRSRVVISVLMAALLALSGCKGVSSPPAGTATYRVFRTPEGVVEFESPPGWHIGYRDLRSRISFDKGDSESSVSERAPGIRDSLVGHLLMGNADDPTEEMEISAIWFQEPVHSAEELASRLTPVVTKTYVSEKGGSYQLATVPKVEALGSVTLVANSSNKLSLQIIRLGGGSQVSSYPYHCAYQLLNEHVALSISVELLGDESATTDSFERARQNVRAVVASVRYMPTQQ